MGRIFERSFAPYCHLANIEAYRDRGSSIYKSHLDYAWVGIPQSPPFLRTTTTADATSNTGHTIVDTAASIIVVFVATAAAVTPGGSNLAWRSGLNDRPRFERRPRTRDS